MRASWPRAVPTWVLVAIPMSVAAVANFLWIGRQSLWQDEGFTAQMVTGPWSLFWTQIFTYGEGNMVAYYLLLRIWPFHESEAGLRSLSAVCVVAAVPLVFWIGRHLGNRVAGWWAACFFALWLFIVRFGQEARSYGLLILITVAATAALMKATSDGGRRWWLVYGGLLGLSVYVHMFAVLMVLPQFLWIAMRRPPTRRVAVGAITAALVSAPMLLYLALNLGSSRLDWITRPTLESLWSQVVQPMAGYSYFMLVAMTLAVAGLGALAVARYRSQVPALAMLLTWAIAPLVVALGYSVLVRPVLQPHFVIAIVPAWTLLLGLAISRIPLRVASLVAGIAVLVICGRSMERYYTGFLKPEIREAAALVASQTRPGDVEIALSGIQPALDYYWRNIERPSPGLSGTRLWVIDSADPRPPESTPMRWRLVWQQDLYQVSVALFEPDEDPGS